MHGLEPLPSWEVKNYIEHRLLVAGYKAQPIFTAEAYEAVAEFTEGIPRNVNNFCFNALSLACALRKRVVDSDVVNEVVSDLDIDRLTSASETARTDSTYAALQGVSSSPGAPVEHEEISSPAQAAAYMQQVALKLKDWRQAVERAPSSTPGTSRPGSRTDVKD